MPRPALLDKLDEKLSSADTEEFDGTLPVDADTLAGHPVDYFASKTEVNQALTTYLSSVLGTSY